MKVSSIDVDKYLTTNLYDPSPHRFKDEEKSVTERTIPIIFTCENCDYSVSIKNDDFEKHTKLTHSNLQLDDKTLIDKVIKKNKLQKSSYLDFYCPKCKQATTIVFNGGLSGYWGTFAFEISHIFVIKTLLES